MVLSDISIRRPVLAIVMNLVLLLVGFICWQRLAVRLIPNVDVPVVTVATGYPGANAQVMESQITKPVEEVIRVVDGYIERCICARDEAVSTGLGRPVLRGI